MFIILYSISTKLLFTKINQAIKSLLLQNRQKMLRKQTFWLIFIMVQICGTIYAQENSFELKTVIIDAGHGGKDPGAIIGEVKEKDIVLDVALLTGKLINVRHPEVNVIFTRNKDEFIPLADRADIANKNKADLFISLHVNVFKQSNIYGTETFILGNHRSEENLKVAQLENSVILLEEDYSTRYEGFDPNSAESYIMFELIQNEFLEQSRFFADQIENSFIGYAKRKSRGVKQAGFLVLRRTTMPSVLVELGFISNKSEIIYLVSNEGKQQMAEAIASAFSNYKNRIDSRSVITGNNNNNNNNSSTTSTQTTPKSSVTENVTRNIKHNTIQPIYEKVKNGKWYACQIMASKNHFERNNKIFDSIKSDIFIQYENGLYKYYTCVSSNKQSCIDSLNNLKQTIFQESFLATFINGKKQ